MNSFTGVVQVFYVLFRSKDLRNITWWLLPLFVNCEMLFNFIFLTFQKRILRNIIWQLLPLYANCEILNVERNIEQQKQSPGGVL